MKTSESINKEKTKVGILTLPFNANYGGVLQAYALQTYLIKLGYDTTHIYRDFPEKNKLTQLAKDIVKLLLGRSIRRAIEGRNLARFFKEYVAPRTNRIRTKSDFKCIEKYGFTTIIVGSDQVWRKACIYGDLKMNYFLDFVDGKVNKMTYAASFGIDEWQYDEDETREIRKHIKEFQAVSLREKSGVELCEKYLGADAEHVVDPVMLLSADDYVEVVNKEQATIKGDCLVYLLDKTDEKQAIVKDISDRFGYTPFSVNQSKRKWGLKVKPSVVSWLRGFYEAKFVVTDSFHGCVFSIIFNKPFLIIGNKERGIARFISVLNDFGLEGRMITSGNDNYISIVEEPVQWDEVNRKLKQKRSEATHFLTSFIR
ncbi:polysaccharide pyruvyl transferase family protein [Sunxiuqinia rutila]|uniref:polysaccharide pyruvyl transferase family protein n=1 Tax=Sunxiuqinia rutila TaxID=1397841 RepID=UPI003D3699FE